MGKSPDMTPSQLRIAQFNIQSAYNKKSLLIKFLQEKNIHICLLNETWFKNSRPFSGIPGYTMYSNNAKNEHGGVAILIKDTIKHNLLSTRFYQDIQNIAVTIETERGPLTILCVYCPPTSGHIRIQRLRYIIRDLPKPLFVSGDFNAHHVAFGCATTKGRGNDLYDIIDEADMCILNDGNPTTVPFPNRNPSAIDVTFVSPNLAPICEWSVHDDCMGSYHLPTITDIVISPVRYQINDPIDKFLYNKADWKKFHDLSIQLFQDFQVDVSDPNKSYIDFCERLDLLKNECIPKFQKTSTFKSRPPSPWWNDVCEKHVIETYEALKVYRRDPTIDNYIIYKRKDALKKRTILEQKRDSWRNLCASFCRTTPISRVWNYIKMFKGGKKKINYNDDFINPLLSKLSSDICNVNEDLFNLNNNLDTSKSLLNPFTWAEFQFCLNSRKDTTPGLDDFPYLVIKKLDVSGQKHLLNLFNILWQNNIIPQTWKTQCVVPILKPDKSPHDANSYRPISLSSCIGKLFENLIKTRLDWYAEMNKLIPSIQFGFRRGNSCADSFVSLISDLKHAKSINASAVCAFLDVQGAFDNVDPGILVEILIEAGLPGKLCKWLYNFMSNRILYIKHNNKLHGPRSASRGTMQGATLSPLLYNLYTHEILKYVNNNNVNILQFADDIVLYSVNMNLDLAKQHINLALSKLHAYYNNRLKLTINSDKSSILIISKSTSNIPIKYNNNIIKEVQEKIFLGITVDNKLTFEKHINNISKKCIKSLNLLRCLAGVSWGADPVILDLLYKSLIRSQFDYSSAVYIDSVHAHKLDKIQNKALRIISGAMCSTPIRALEVETKVMPLAIRRIELTVRYLLKLISSKNEFIINKIVQTPLRTADTADFISASSLNAGTAPKLSELLSYVFNKYPNIYHNFSHWPCYSGSYKSKILEVKICNELVQNNSDFLNYINNFHGQYALYTDGSKTDACVHSAIYDPTTNFKQSYRLHELCTVFTAETYAVLKALQYIKTISSNYKNFIILTDSLSLIDCLKKIDISYKLNYLIYMIRELIFYFELMNVSIMFKWIPSHSNISGNEIVDKVARNGVNEIDVRNDVKIPVTDFYGSIRRDLSVIWQDLWKMDQEVNGKGRWYGTVQPDLPVKPWYKKPIYKHASRDFITTINRLRFGHHKTPAHLARLNLFESNSCPYCNNDVLADIDHLLFECCNFSIQRLVLASEISEIVQNNSSRRLSELLKNSLCYKPLFNFIKNTIETL